MKYVPIGSQKDVVESQATTLVVLGGAGTGKTTTAAAAAVAHLQRADQTRRSSTQVATDDGKLASSRAIDRVLFLSFSRTAVAQVVDRAGPLLGKHMNRIEVSTFDGFAWRILTDFGAHFGFPPPLTVVSAADTKVPGAPHGLRYTDLIPGATRVLKSSSVSNYYSRRFSLLICDEFQDLGDHEWEFLRLIAPPAHRIFLGDVNQCIYAEMKKIEPEARVAQALALPGAERVDLPPASHRDPSGVLPAAADAARSRRFSDPAIRAAVISGRLTLVPAASAAFDSVAQIIRDARLRRHTVSVFTHTNSATAALSDYLARESILHEQVGFGEAFGAALHAQMMLVRWALRGDEGGRRALAVFLTANSRGRMPALGREILDRSNPQFEAALKPITDQLQAAANLPVDYDKIIDVVKTAWTQIGPSQGQETWLLASRTISKAVKRMESGDQLDSVIRIIEHDRSQAILIQSSARPRAVQVMNLHQTKGREADETVLLLQDVEFHGYEVEPYSKGSRLLYVVLTRARHKAHIVVPPSTHGLWTPLVDACLSAMADKGKDSSRLTREV